MQGTQHFWAPGKQLAVLIALADRAKCVDHEVLRTPQWVLDRFAFGQDPIGPAPRRSEGTIQQRAHRSLPMKYSSHGCLRNISIAPAMLLLWRLPCCLILQMP